MGVDGCGALLSSIHVAFVVAGKILKFALLGWIAYPRCG